MQPGKGVTVYAVAGEIELVNGGGPAIACHNRGRAGASDAAADWSSGTPPTCAVATCMRERGWLLERGPSILINSMGSGIRHFAIGTGVPQLNTLHSDGQHGFKHQAHNGYADVVGFYEQQEGLAFVGAGQTAKEGCISDEWELGWQQRGAGVQTTERGCAVQARLGRECYLLLVFTIIAIIHYHNYEMLIL